MDARLKKIDHIVVLLMENRSFDHFLGYLALAGKAVDGPTGNEFNQWQGKTYRLQRAGDRVVAADPPHSLAATAQQLADGNKGFVAAYMAARGNDPKARPDDVMLYYDQEMLPIYDFLAREYCICDKWFSSMPGPTWPNRMYALAGTSGGRTNNDLPAAPGLPFPTVLDILTSQGLDWRFYEHDVGCIRMFASHLGDDQRVIFYDDPKDGFALRARAGTLPPVTFIDPDFTDVPGIGKNDDHPPTHPAVGQKLVRDIYELLRRSPQWPRTMFIITYDEAGGFYDHVVPGEAADEHIPRYGLRVPAFVISPWVGRGAVRSDVYDHTTIIKTILNRFVPPGAFRLSRRVDAARDLGATLTEPSARLPAPPAPAFEVPAHKALPEDFTPTDLREGVEELKRRRDAARAARGQR